MYMKKEMHLTIFAKETDMLTLVKSDSENCSGVRAHQLRPSRISVSVQREILLSKFGRSIVT